MAKANTCRNNLKQAGLALHLRADDYEDEFPDFNVETCGPNIFLHPSKGMDLRPLIEPYFEDLGIYRCPAIPSAPLDRCEPRLNGSNQPIPDYATYMWFIGREDPDFGDIGVDPKRSKSKRPSRQPIIQDTLFVYNETTFWSKYNHGDGVIMPKPTKMAFNQVIGYIFDMTTTNILYIDGHTKGHKLKNLVSRGHSSVDHNTTGRIHSSRY